MDSNTLDRDTFGFKCFGKQLSIELFLTLDHPVRIGSVFGHAILIRTLKNFYIHFSYFLHNHSYCIKYSCTICFLSYYLLLSQRRILNLDSLLGWSLLSTKIKGLKLLAVFAESAPS